MYYPFNSPHFLCFPEYLPSSQLQHNQMYYPDYAPSHNERVLPPTEPQSLKNSAEKTKQLLSDVQIINETIRTSPTFAQQITSAAQKSDHQTVHYMVNNLPIKNKASVSYSPGGISIKIVHKESDCCYIVMFLNWREFF